MKHESRIMKKDKNIERFSSHDSYFMLHTSDSRGFTLVEIMVAVSIFTIVMLMATGALLSILDSNRKVQSQQNIFSNLDFALESMSRTIRVGTKYRCLPGLGSGNIEDTQDCTSGSNTIFAFEGFNGKPDSTLPTSSSDQIVYCRFNGVSCHFSGKQIARSNDGGDTFVPITSPEIIIEGLNFFVRGSTSGNGEQPVVFISVYGCAGVAPSTSCPTSPTKKSVEFSLQTTVVQRLLDI